MEEIGFVEDGELHSNRLCSVAQLHPTLCYSMDCMLPGSSVHGIFQARILELGCHFLLQGIFLTWGLNLHLLHLLHWQEDYLPLHHLGSLHSSHDKSLSWRVYYWLCDSTAVSLWWRYLLQHDWLKLNGIELQFTIHSTENPHGQRKLAGYHPSGHKEWDTTEWLSTAQHCRLVSTWV